MKLVINPNSNEKGFNVFKGECVNKSKGKSRNMKKRKAFPHVLFKLTNCNIFYHGVSQPTGRGISFSFFMGCKVKRVEKRCSIMLLRLPFYNRSTLFHHSIEFLLLTKFKRKIVKRESWFYRIK